MPPTAYRRLTNSDRAGLTLCFWISCCPARTAGRSAARYERPQTCPIIMLSAKGETFDKVLGLELGADDYVTKPFDTKELVARIKSVIRRTKDAGAEPAAADTQEVEYENLYVSLTNYKLRVNGRDIDAPPKEIELLYHLAKNPNRVFTRRPAAGRDLGL